MPTPPKIAKYLLKLFLPLGDREFLVGDYQFIYDEIYRKQGKLKADTWYWRHTLKTIPQFTINSITGAGIMFSSYLKIAIRNLRKYKGYSFINIFGLSVGLVSFIYLMMFVKYELSYDSFHENSDRIHRIGMHWEGWSFKGSSDFASMNGALVPTLKTEYPEVEYATRVVPVSSSLKYEEIPLVEDGFYADNDFLKMFSFSFIEGDNNASLISPFSIVLTEELANKLFGSQNPVGKIISGIKGKDFKVTGVIKDIPENSHLQFDFLMSFETYRTFRLDNIDNNWRILNYYNYIMLKQNVNYHEFEKKLEAVVEKYHADDDEARRYFLQPLESIYLSSHLNSEISENSDIQFIYLLISIAFTILILAIVNYLNLTTSRAALRVREVGIRKAVGAERTELIYQFMGESFLITTVAFLISLFIVYLTHPYFTQTINQNVLPSILYDTSSIVGFIALIIIVGFLSGAYPSFLLSSFKPINALKEKNTFTVSGRGKIIRNSLVVFQFSVSIILIAATIVIQKQLHFIETTDIGYSRENILTIRLWTNEESGSYETIREELLKKPGVINASVSDKPPIKRSEVNRAKVETGEPAGVVILPQVCYYFVDDAFIDLYEIKIKNGRGFSKLQPTDEDGAVIVNEAFVRELGVANPLGCIVKNSDNYNGRIVGIAKDFNYMSLTEKIEPMAFLHSTKHANYFSVRIANNNIMEILNHIKTTFQTQINDFVFNYSFLEDSYNNLYKSESKLGSIIAIFSTIAISIASFGLLGLISFMTTQKTKEIGIRKILGASVSGIIGLIMKEFAVLAIFSSIIAMPISYLIMKNWLESFAYRIDFTLSILLMSVLITVLIASISIIFQVIKSATANPIKSLKYE